MGSTVKDKHVEMRDFLFNKYKKMTFSSVRGILKRTCNYP